MALEPKITVCQSKDCQSLEIDDITGDYDALTNTGGYGSPNLAKVDVVSTEIVITDPSGNVYTINSTSTLPNTTLTVNNTDLGTSGDIVDGVYLVTYNVTDVTPTTYTYSKDHLFYCQVQCLVYSAILSLDIDCIKCDFDDVDNIIELYAYLKMLEIGAIWDRQTKFTNLLAHINKLALVLCNDC